MVYYKKRYESFLVGMDHFIFKRGGGGGGEITKKKFLHSKSVEKKSCAVGQDKKNRARDGPFYFQLVVSC